MKATNFAYRHSKDCYEKPFSYDVMNYWLIHVCYLPLNVDIRSARRVYRSGLPDKGPELKGVSQGKNGPFADACFALVAKKWRASLSIGKDFKC
ncbi:hypothetical protein PNOK_0510300 [Pyrrhoderma noxium]|uniref:Uncharacterized protein n=1 Tax=Pyrrhoderma noxium TaxID=2282107 RepID=A0A286UKW7_9AGAM|nr:hypothetical protein PNOK_0510300 [Pyrrhoderma noxium]